VNGKERGKKKKKNVDGGGKFRANSSGTTRRKGEYNAGRTAFLKRVMESWVGWHV